MRSVAKGNYIKGRGGKAKAVAHVRYVQFRRGDDRDQDQGKSRLFYNSDREGISGREVQRYVHGQGGGVVVHRIVLSPGLEGVDMNEYTRYVMKELGDSKGQDLEYFATNHRNTDHEHAHVVLMGQDKHGRLVRLYAEQYRVVREAGDRYLERHHYFDRYLDKDIPNLMKHGYVRDKGDDSFELLLADLKSPKAIEEIDRERLEKQRESSFDMDKALSKLPEGEKINRDGQVYTKYSRLKELKEFDQKLRDGEVSKLPKEQYGQLWSWIGTKQRLGDDYYERTGEHERLQLLFEEELRRSLQQDNSPRKSYQQYIYESRGRLLESHEQYLLNTSRADLKRQLKELEESGDPDPDKRRQIEEQLEWLNELAEERNGPVKKEKSGEESLSPEKSKAQEKEKADLDEPKPKGEVRPVKDGEKEAVNKDKDGDSKGFEQEKTDAPVKPDQERTDQEAERETREREEQRLDQERSDREREQQRLDEETRAKEEQERIDREGREQEERDRLDEEARERADQEAREREEQRRLAEQRAKEESERLFKMQQEMDRARQQQLEQKSGSKDSGGTSRLQKKIDEVEREIGESEGDPQDILDQAKPPLDLDKDVDLSKSQPGILDHAQPILDLDKGIEENWSLDEKAIGDDHEIDNLLDSLDRPDEQDRLEPSDINDLLFGDGAETEHGLGEYEKLPEELRIENWERDAFDPELIKEQQDREEQDLGDETERPVDEPAKQQQQLDPGQQMQQAIQLQIARAFIEPERGEDDKDEHRHDDKQQDQGGEHGR